MSDMLEAALQYGAACKRLVNCKLENANEQITAALFDEIKRLRAENAELQHELTKGIHTCGPKCRKTARCTEMADLREELVDTKAALFSAEMRAQSAEKPNCKTCDHYIPPLSFAGEPACEFANTESVLVCINGDAYVPADPVRLYDTARKGEGE